VARGQADTRRNRRMTKRGPLALAGAHGPLTLGDETSHGWRRR
jgi:hypothetical protein